MKPNFAQLSIQFIAGLLVFLGLPLLSWGVTDIQGFLQNPARLAYAFITLALQIAAVAVFPNLGSGSGKGVKLVNRQRTALLLIQFVSLGATILAPYSDRHAFAVFPESEFWRYIGLALFASGFWLMLWAAAILGKQFSVQVTVQKDHKLITSGPYRVLRHPRYSGILMFLLGYALVFRSGIALIFVAAMVLVLSWRIHDEEKLMREEFQTEWDAYARRTRRLIPFVY